MADDLSWMAPNPMSPADWDRLMSRFRGKSLPVRKIMLTANPIVEGSRWIYEAFCLPAIIDCGGTPVYADTNEALGIADS